MDATTAAALPRALSAHTSSSIASAPPLSIPFPPSVAHSDSEVSGFVLWLSSFVLFALYLLWALLPDSVLRGLGVTYYPDRWWSLVVPAYTLVLLLFVPLVYFAFNLAFTAPLDAMSTVRDGWTRQQQREIAKTRQATAAAAATGHHRPRSASEEAADAAYGIEEIVDIPLETVNRLMYRKR